MGLRFNGTSQYIEVANESFFDRERTQPHSGALWVLYFGGTGGPILSKASSGTGTGVGWAFNVGAPLNFHLTADNAANNEIFRMGPDDFTPGGLFPWTWQHVGFTYDGSSTLAGCAVYHHGVEVNGDGTPPNEDNLSASILTNTPVRSGWIDPSEYVAVGVSNIAWYDVELTPAEMAVLADPKHIGVNPLSLVSTAPKLWLPLSAVTDLSDRSGNGNNATATGSPTTIADPAVMFDQVTASNGTTSFSFTHTPIVASPKGVTVLILENVGVSDVISDVTYGGVPMTRVDRVVDSAGEPGSAYSYFLGKGVPAGAQTVAVTVSSGTTSKRVIAVTVDAGGDTQIAASGTQTGDQANPSVTLPTRADFRGLVVAALHSGHNGTASLAAGSEYLALGQHDWGSQVVFGQMGTKEGANVACGFTALSEDVAMVALAIERVPVARPEAYVRSDAFHRRSRW